MKFTREQHNIFCHEMEEIIHQRTRHWFFPGTLMQCKQTRLNRSRKMKPLDPTNALSRGRQAAGLSSAGFSPEA
jgi:hypothetical protein